MSQLQRTEFQDRCIERCRNIVTGALGLHIAFEQEGLTERYFVGAVSFAGHRLEVFIYEDEVEFSVDNDAIDRRFEKWDYASSDELIEAFARQLSETLSSLCRAANNSNAGGPPPQ